MKQMLTAMLVLLLSCAVQADEASRFEEAEVQVSRLRDRALEEVAAMAAPVPEFRCYAATTLRGELAAKPMARLDRFCVRRMLILALYNLSAERFDELLKAHEGR